MSFASMLSLFSSSLSFNVGSPMLHTAARAPVVNMKGALETDFIYEAPAPLGKALGCVLEPSPIAGATGSVAPTGGAAGVASKTLEQDFNYEGPAPLGKALGCVIEPEPVAATAGSTAPAGSTSAAKTLEQDFNYETPAPLGYALDCVLKPPA